jgi:hypothetical protein
VTTRPLLIAALALSATLAPRPADAGADEGPTLRWVEATGAVEVVGLDYESLRRLDRLARAADRWSEILSIRLDRGKDEPEARPIVGRYEVAGKVLRFTPRYPPIAGKKYVARFRPDRIPEATTQRGPIESTFTAPAAPAGPSTTVVAVYPTASTLPENQLKLYLHFSGSMSRGEAYRRVRLLDSAGRQVALPFLEIGEELWDPDQTRLTLLFDPGRIKRGLKPREEEGPILEDGKSYTLVVDPTWHDASGRPLGSAYEKAFRVGPPDEIQPDPARWTFDIPARGTREPLVVRFPEPLDQAMLLRAIGVTAGDRPVGGRIEVGQGERSWRFIPETPWDTAPIALRVDPELEDLAGNSVARPFEVDVVKPRTDGRPPGPVIVPVLRKP